MRAEALMALICTPLLVEKHWNGKDFQRKTISDRFQGKSAWESSITGLFLTQTLTRSIWQDFDKRKKSPKDFKKRAREKKSVNRAFPHADLDKVVITRLWQTQTISKRFQGKSAWKKFDNRSFSRADFYKDALTVAIDLRKISRKVRVRKSPITG